MTASDHERLNTGLLEWAKTDLQVDKNTDRLSDHEYRIKTLEEYRQEQLEKARRARK